MEFVQRLPLLLLFLLGCGNSVPTTDVQVNYQFQSNTNGVVQISVTGDGTTDANAEKTNDGGQFTYTIDTFVEDVPQGSYNGVIELRNGNGDGIAATAVIETFTLVVDEFGSATLTLGGGTGPGGAGGPGGI